LTITYDEIGDILYLETVKPYPEQETEHLGPDVLGRINPRTGEIENIEVLFFRERRWGGRALALPVLAEMRRSARARGRPRDRASSRRPRKK